MPEEVNVINPQSYPLARKDGCVIDDYSGTKVCDPYRWLEDPDSKETIEYVKKLNNISRPFIAGCSVREQMRTRLTQLWDYEKYGCTSKRGKYYYYFYNTGLQNQSVLYQQKSLSDEGEVFLDPNVLSDDGTTAIRQSCFTHDGSIYAYGLSEKGSDWMTLRFKTADGEVLKDVVTGVKHSDLSWLHDNSGILYSRYPEHKGATEGCNVEKDEYHSLYFHKLGTDEKEDILVSEFRSDARLMCTGSVTEDGRFLIVDVNRGCDPTNQLYYYDLAEVKNKIDGKVDLKPMFKKFDAKYDFVDNDGDSALVLTNLNAPMFKLVRVKMADADDPSQWEVLVEEEKKNKLDWVAPVAGDRLVLTYLEDVKNTVYVHCRKSGKRLYQIPLEIGSVTGFFGRKNLSEIFLSFESFLIPTIIYRGDFEGLKLDEPIKLKEHRVVKLPNIDATQFKVDQVFSTSKDGTKCPIFIVHRCDMVLNGRNPVMLSGYGGFNVADTPCFSVSRLLMLTNFRGIVAVANLRGGSEYGEKWHEGGMREKKQNVFDDFIAAAEYLIEKKYTSPSKLAIQGGSNGGLLVAVCSQQRPELFGAVINRVGVMDMLRYHKFTIGGAWIPEYGNPEVAKDFSFIYKYSPLHNISIPVRGHEWPATLLMIADHDDRVVPSHSLKYIATLYEKIHEAGDFQKKPVLIRIEVRAGHGQGKPTSKQIDEVVDLYSFVQRTLSLEWFE
ncbi:hypothetical protein AB6A40_000053 [Gnathostoma spinigerum]|uniref:Prolyl endopeptidase n=1 Tax=Gnathostoma spinigerum TaxID=75299 RepID=A0ABD6E5J6_9BILA